MFKYLEHTATKILLIMYLTKNEVNTSNIIIIFQHHSKNGNLTKT